MERVRYPRRLIESDLWISRISENARAEKDSRAAHIPRLHIYPAARPPSACRAVICAALWPDPVELGEWSELVMNTVPDRIQQNVKPDLFLSSAKEAMTDWANNLNKLVSEESLSNLVKIQKKSSSLEDLSFLRQVLLDFIADFSTWDSSKDQQFLEVANRLTLSARETLAAENSLDQHPLVFDPFAGGGAMPLEALAVGCNAFASDLSPVAVLIQKVVLEYIPKYGNALADALDRWCAWSKEKLIKDLGDFYPIDEAQATPVTYLFARTVLSEAPDGGDIPIEIPLLSTLWLARQKNRKAAMRWVRNDDGEVITDTCSVKYASGETYQVRRPLLEIFEPKNNSDVEKGTVARNAATCPVSGYTMSAKQVEKQLKTRYGGASDARLYCVAIDPKEGRRTFRMPIEEDFAAIQAAATEIDNRSRSWKGKFPLVPNEEIPGTMTGVLGAPIYGHNTWGALFTPRQQLALTSYCQSVGEYIETLDTTDTQFKKAVAATLGLVVNRLADLNSALCGWQLNTPNAAHVFTRWALPMIMDFGEVNPLAGAGGSPESAIKRIKKYLLDTSPRFEKITQSGNVQQCPAAEHPLPKDSADLMATDPPYYNAIPYADILDFFYVWSKRSVGEIFPSLFKEDLGPKDKEACELAGWDSVRYSHKDKSYFESEMTKALNRGRESVRPDGLAIVVFAHKSTAGWEAMLGALIDAGWIITASWPIDTEMGTRSRARNSATLNSSVHLVCRPREYPDGSLCNDYVGDWRDVLDELPKCITNWMIRLGEEGIVGADAIFACLGPALEIFSRYSYVERADGTKVALREYLENVWAAVSKGALATIFSDADTAGLEEDARLTCVWLWTIAGGESNTKAKESEKKTAGFSLDFDAARKIAQGLGANLDKLKNLVTLEKNNARLLSITERSKSLFGTKSDATTSSNKQKDRNTQQKLSFQQSEDIAEQESALELASHSLDAADTTLARLHQIMLIFAEGRGELLKKTITSDGYGTDPKFWKLAQALSYLYPEGTEEKRWVDGVLAKKKSLGL